MGIQFFGVQPVDRLSGFLRYRLLWPHKCLRGQHDQQGKEPWRSPQQGFGPGIGVRLEGTPDFTVWIIFRSGEGCLNFCRMMSIVINDGNAVNLPFIFEAAVGTPEAGQSQFDLSIGMFSSIAVAIAAREFETLCIPVTFRVMCSSFSPLTNKS